jgi:hypothetical protein
MIQLKVEIFLCKSKGAEKDTSFYSFSSLSSFCKKQKKKKVLGFWCCTLNKGKVILLKK